MPVINGTRDLVPDLAACVKAGIPRDRILATYPTITEHHRDLAVTDAEADPSQGRTCGFPPWPGATSVSSGQIPRRKG